MRIAVSPPAVNDTNYGKIILGRQFGTSAGRRGLNPADVKKPSSRAPARRVSRADRDSLRFERFERVQIPPSSCVGSCRDARPPDPLAFATRHPIASSAWRDSDERFHHPKPANQATSFFRRSILQTLLERLNNRRVEPFPGDRNIASKVDRDQLDIC
jgi:hypothetical protein